ncbi:hypothetical protein MMC2321_01909 [Chitinophaga sp. MM2321]
MLVTTLTDYMILGTLLALFGLYKMGFVSHMRDFFTGKD